MYLKSIEIQGFKSFANKILFEFHNGITGIVGPNGSGKSNVADAVRWVLGEQRVKQLRGGTMQDVIFSGTEVRKPQGFAYVAITLDNSDHKLPISFDEVTISRRLYRSGESEYRMNGSACRLKDVNELFYDTGIGKEGYSIIGQGQIDKILSGRPEERRELFDEAAGIVKYKRRKLIAQKKLEDEKQNLVRVTDILSELEKQVGPLKEQSVTAKEYLRLREEQKRLDANLFLSEASSIQEQEKELKGKEGIVSEDLEAVKNEAEHLKAEYNELETIISNLEKEILEKKEQIRKCELGKESFEGQIGILKEQINTEKMNAEHMKTRITVIDEELAEKESKKEEYLKEKDLLLSECQTYVKQHQEAEERLKNAELQLEQLEQALEEGKADIIRVLNEKADLAAKRQRYETMLEQVEVRRSEVCQKLLRFKTDEAVQEEQIEEEKKHLSKIQEYLAECQEKEGKFQAEFEKGKTEETCLIRCLHDSQQEYNTCITKLESLKNLAERYDGYGNSIKRVMEVRDRLDGIHGVVADLISTTKKYEIAIETALGGSIQNVVTDSEQTAKKLIEYLKKNKYGRATFLPITSIGNKNSFQKQEVLQEQGVLGLAHELITVKKEYEGLAKYLLGRIVVVDQIDHAIALAKKYQYSLRIVTLEGELLSAGGSMTGGAFKNSSNLLGRKREIEELEEACQRALKNTEKFQKELTENEIRLEEIKKTLHTIKDEKQKAFLKQNTSTINVTQLETKKREIKLSSEDLVAENQELELQIREIKENQDILQEDIRKLEVFYEKRNQEVKKGTDELEKRRANREALVNELSVVQMEEAAMKQKTDFMNENLSRIYLEIEKFSEEKEQLNTGGNKGEEIISDKLNEIERLKQQIADTQKRISDLQQITQKKQEQKEDLALRQKSFFEKQQELSDRKNHLDKELFRLQSQREKLTERMEIQINYMWNEYELTFSTAETLRDVSLTPVSNLKKQLESIKNQIRGLGNVNVNAIEEYKEISERYEFLKEQHNDLVIAEETLLKIIDELDMGMRKQFEEKFKDISHEFDRVFRELFGGGHGKLQLQEEEDILEAGIQIISQPPGKKLQNMMQLSGGEKALTAISLLFAIQNLKPSPFCLLDEIEAALDDSNVDRFAKYLNKLAPYTQFIVITHRRGTMVASDRLYGITMQEKGVSTLVSVNLIESELEK